jgi:CMP-N,N'-diacetyllegionaminic acid synthase
MALRRVRGTGLPGLGVEGVSSKDAVLAIVPARGGSKGVPGKNLARVAGQSLVCRAVVSGREAGLPVLLSTDDELIRSEGTSAGALAPFLRPPHLATDAAPTSAVLQHAVTWFEQNYGHKLAAIVTLQPTTPLRAAADVLGALTAYETRPAGCRSVVTVCHTGHLSLGVLYPENPEGIARPIQPTASSSRHEEPPLLIRNGAVYITERDLLMQQAAVMCDTPAVHVMPRWRSINIDDPFELHLAQLLAQYPPAGRAAEA